MSSGVITIGITIVIISIVIFLIENFKDVLEFIDKVKNKKYFKIIYTIVICIILILFVKCIYKEILSIKFNIDFYKTSVENSKMFAGVDEKIHEENKFYKNAINQNYENQNSQNPYIPEGFEYLEGEWNNGFVIQDKNQNEYVWVPCSNKENEEIIKLEKNNLNNPAFISKDYCADEEYENFITSALENGGFYISRYEIGNENNIPVSKPNVEVWTNLTRSKAIELSNGMYQNINSKLINGYAYDTTLSWIMKNNNIVENKVNIENQEKIYTGREKCNNVYDFLDNVMEHTLELNYDTSIVRGFLDEDTDCRYSIFENQEQFSNNTPLAFRTVLYK